MRGLVNICVALGFFLVIIKCGSGQPQFIVNADSGIPEQKAYHPVAISETDVDGYGMPSDFTAEPYSSIFSLISKISGSTKKTGSARRTSRSIGLLLKISEFAFDLLKRLLSIFNIELEDFSELPVKVFSYVASKIVPFVSKDVFNLIGSIGLGGLSLPLKLLG